MATTLPTWLITKKILMRTFLCSSILFLSVQTSLAAQDIYYEKASQLINDKDYVEAYNEVQELLKERPEDIYLLRLKGICLMEAGYYDAAVSVLRKAIVIDPDSDSRGNRTAVL